jgi:hypothetical protein
VTAHNGADRCLRGSKCAIMSTMRYTEAFDMLDDVFIPRRKYAPVHWLTQVYFLGRRVGARAYCVLKRNPFVIFYKGMRDAWVP